jgi:hypothetical protein
MHARVISAQHPVGDIQAPHHGRRTVPSGLRYAAATAAGSEVIIAGGTTDAGPRSDIYAFDTARATIHHLALLGRPLSDAAVAPGSNETLLIGGWRGSVADRVPVAKLASTNAGSP